jgi:hypothetical protein
MARQELKERGLVAKQDHAVTVLRRLDLQPAEQRDAVHHQPGRVVSFHRRTRVGFRPGQKWTVRQVSEALGVAILERGGIVRELDLSAKGRWDVFTCATLPVAVGEQVRITAGFREGRHVFKNNDLVRIQEVNDQELVFDDGRRMRRDGARIDQGVCLTSHASQCRTVDQVVVLPADGADAKSWYVSLSRARHSMHVFCQNKATLKQDVTRPGERKSVWEMVRNFHSMKVMSPSA